MATPMDARSETNLVGLMPEFADVVRTVAADFAQVTGSFFVVVQGLRSYDQQHKLYMQSRTTPPTGPWVTNADGWHSNHNFGMAVDVVPDADTTKAGLQPDWDTTHPHWKILIALMKLHGLQWGGDWQGTKGDMDHFQYAKSPASPTAGDIVLAKTRGIPAVWDFYRKKV